MQVVLADFAGKDVSAIVLLRNIFDWLRPNTPADKDFVSIRIEELEKTLQEDPETEASLAEILQNWLDKASYFHAFAALGLLPRQGFLRELGRRLYERINPPPKNGESLVDALDLIFYKRKDPEWISALSEDNMVRLFKILWHFKNGDMAKRLDKTLRELLYAMEMLSIWVASEELEPDLVRIEPRIVARDSAFLALQREIYHYCRNYETWIDGNSDTLEDDSHARVILDQCIQTVNALRKKTVVKGTSISLSYLLERLDQTLKRIHDMLDLLNPHDPLTIRHTAIQLFRELVTASQQRHSALSLIQTNIKLLSRNITENTSDHGEHYITRSRSEYLAMLRSGAGGGVIIALMALIKIFIIGMEHSPFIETVWVSLNYGLGFMLIHILHLTVATKQPAMTASRLAGEIEKRAEGGVNSKKIAAMLLQVSRSQFIAIVGNVALAFSLAFLIGWAFTLYQGAPIIDTKTRDYQLYELKPFASLAIFHASIAGVWLFLSGLTAGFFDNRAAYIGLGSRLKVHPVLRYLIPRRAREGLADYLDENYGALVGNFFFGVLLGCTSYVGLLTGLPIGIRHVAFASGNLGYALSAQLPTWLEFGRYFFYIFLISFCNLWVSFGLALFVALKSRNASIKSPTKIVSAFFWQIRSAPLSFLFPPMDKEVIRKEKDSLKT